MNVNANESIQCSVTSCAHHCGDRNYCSLNAIQVGCCNCIPTQCEGTECASFRLRETR